MWIIPKPIGQRFPCAPDMLVCQLPLKEQGLIFHKAFMWRSKPSSAKIWSRRLKKAGFPKELSTRMLKPFHLSVFEKFLTSLLQEGYLASHSVVLDKEKLMKTPDISCPMSSKELKTVSQILSCSKTSKECSVQNSKETTGQTQKEHRYCSISLESWREEVINVRGNWSVRVKSVRPTGGKESLSWPTAASRDWKDSAGMSKARDGNPLGRIDQLPRAVYHYGQPDQANSSTTGKSRGLSENTWRTPTTAEAKNQCSSQQIYLQNQVGAIKKNWPTPAAQTHEKSGSNQMAGGKAGREILESALGKGYAGKLNGNWVSQLMNLPVGWVSPGLPIKTKSLTVHGANGTVYMKTVKEDFDEQKAYQKTRAREVLWEVRKTITQEGLQWPVGRLLSFLEEEVLRSGVLSSIYGKSIAFQIWLAQASSEVQEKSMRRMWNCPTTGDSSQRPRYDQYFIRELDDIMCQLSYEIALERGQKVLETSGSLYHLWEDWEKEAWDVSKALPEMEEIWKSSFNQEERQNRLYFQATHSGINRTDELRMLGNGVVPAQAERAIRLLIEKLRTPVEKDPEQLNLF